MQFRFEDDGQTKIDVKFDNETVWLTQKQMAQLFDKDSDTIGLHLKNIYQSVDLEELLTTDDYSVVQQEGKRQVGGVHVAGTVQYQPQPEQNPFLQSEHQRLCI